MNPTTISKYSAITPVENINCPVMLVSGTDDLNVPTDFTVKFIIDRLKENGKEHLCTNLRYPQAGHLIEPPYSPLCDSSFSKSSKEWCVYPYLAWGGETVAHARAQEECWPKILHILRKKSRSRGRRSLVRYVIKSFRFNVPKHYACKFGIALIQSFLRLLV